MSALLREGKPIRFRLVPRKLRVAVIWIIEQLKRDETTAAAVLVGDYAIRLFASPASFVRLAPLERESTPDLVIFDLDDAGMPVLEAETMITGCCPDVPRIYLARCEALSAAGSECSPSVLVQRKPLHSLALTELVRLVLRRRHEDGEERCDRQVIRFRDVQLDTERFVCEIKPHGQAESLPPKEARLLRLFLERPGQCLSREDIRTVVWDRTAVSFGTINSHVSRLRHRLKDSEVTIESVYGGGYILK